jgi:hypothetical protein
MSTETNTNSNETSIDALRRESTLVPRVEVRQADIAQIPKAGSVVSILSDENASKTTPEALPRAFARVREDVLVFSDGHEVQGSEQARREHITDSVEAAQRWLMLGHVVVVCPGTDRARDTQLRTVASLCATAEVPVIPAYVALRGANSATVHLG